VLFVPGRLFCSLHAPPVLPRNGEHRGRATLASPGIITPVKRMAGRVLWRLSIAAIAAVAFVASAVSVGATAASPSARAVVAGLRCLGQPIGGTVVYTAATDPNHLLGRPGGYISKANFRDTRLTPQSSDFAIADGGSVEAFPNTADAQRRQGLLEALAKGSPLFTEYDYRQGTVLLRLASRLTPKQATPYGAALTAFLNDPEKARSSCKQAQAPAKTKPSPPPQPKDARVSPYVGGNASPRLPAGPPGVLAVVARGPYGQTLPIVVRNNTTRTVIRIAVSATASTPGGRLLATGKDASIGASVACFSTRGQLLYTARDFTDQDRVAPKQTLPFQVDASPPYGSSGLSCPVYLVAASGYT
jgi:hypothetical protein